MIPSRLAVILPGAGFLFMTAAAFAHPGHAQDGSGFLAGLIHPLTGIDHIAFMLMLGIWIAWRAAAAGLRVALSIMLMQLFALLATFISLPAIIWESGIALSLATMGLMLWRGSRASGASLALITFAAGLHAAVHWVEMAPDTAVVSYGLGMVLASALLYAAGYGIGSAIRPYAERVARVMGLTLAGSGLAWLLLG